MDDIQRLRDLAVSDTGFVFDPYTGATFSVNQTGYTILNVLKAGGDREAIFTALQETFEIGENSDLERDVAEFVRLMRNSGILSRDFAI